MTAKVREATIPGDITAPPVLETCETEVKNTWRGNVFVQKKSSQGCVQASKDMQAWMNTSVEPCEDFYTFSCGGFDDKEDIPDGKGSVTSFSVINDKVDDQVGKSAWRTKLEWFFFNFVFVISSAGKIRRLLEENITESDPEPYKSAKKYFASCTNTDSIEVKYSFRDLMLGYDRVSGGGFGTLESAIGCSRWLALDRTSLERWRLFMVPGQFFEKLKTPF